MKQLEIIKNTVKIGLKKPVKVLHVTDTHIALDDDGTNSGRNNCFDCGVEGQAIDLFLQAKAYAKNNNIPMLHTGDFLDFLSQSNFDFADKAFADLDYIYAAGNHDFCHIVGQAKEDYDYKWEKIKLSAPHFDCNLYFDSRVIDGLNFVTLDNTYYFISLAQIEVLKAEVARGYPIVLCMHVPFYTQALAKEVLDAGNDCAYVCGAPEELLKTYCEHRYNQQKPDHETLLAIEYIMSQPLIKCFVTGHTHNNHVEEINGKLQITTHGSFAGFAREITFI